jgi:hypothetical protein
VAEAEAEAEVEAEAGLNSIKSNMQTDGKALNKG